MIKLPKHVEETIEALEKTKDPRSQTIVSLTQPRQIEESWDKKKDYPVEQNYEAMWVTIERHERRNGNDFANNQWVLDFLDDVIDAQELPKYMYLKNEDRVELMVKVNALAAELSDIFSVNKICINPRLKKALDRNDLRTRPTDSDAQSLDEIDIVAALNFHSQCLIKNISSAEFLTKKSKGIEYRSFLRALARRNEFLYGRKLLEVVSTAGWAIFGENTSISTISNIVSRSQEF